MGGLLINGLWTVPAIVRGKRVADEGGRMEDGGGMCYVWLERGGGRIGEMVCFMWHGIFWKVDRIVLANVFIYSMTSLQYED
jgi:hypothetical protein